MFKAAFPWAKHAEEAAEKEHVKSLESVSQDEVAGNVWISEHYGKGSFNGTPTSSPSNAIYSYRARG